MPWATANETCRLTTHRGYVKRQRPGKSSKNTSPLCGFYTVVYHLGSVSISDLQTKTLWAACSKLVTRLLCIQHFECRWLILGFRSTGSTAADRNNRKTDAHRTKCLRLYTSHVLTYMWSCSRGLLVACYNISEHPRDESLQKCDLLVIERANVN